MLIGDYFAEISRLVHDYETAGFIQSSDVLTEARSDDLGYLRATFVFSDHSQLHVREFAKVHRDQIERLSFAYHYQNRSGDLRFRYDNAVHRPKAPFPVHKHLPDRIILAEELTLREVFRELVREYLKR
jgi:hypothetical protein